MAVRVREDFRSLSGPEKTAIFLLAVGEEHARVLVDKLDEDEIREISQVMSNLGTVSSGVVEKLFIDFADQLNSTGSLVGSYETTERLLMRIMDPGRVNNLMEEIRGPAGRTMWDKLGNVNEETLANYLKNEYPQTVAVVLSKIKSDHSARVLALLPESFSLEVIMRMLRMEAVQKEVLSDVERTLRTEFMNNLARTNRRDAHEMIADIFNNLDRSVESRFITSLEERNRESAEKIKSLMFTFDDLGNLDTSAIQTILRAVDKELLPISLKGASDKVKDMFFNNMSERASKILREDMAAMGPVRLKDVDEAQQKVVVMTKDLAAKGEIMIAEGGDDELIY